MRGMSKKAKAEGYDKLEHENHALREFVIATVNGIEPNAVESFEHDGDTYTFALHGLDRAHGGIVVYTFASPVNKGTSVDVYFFEDWLRAIDKIPHGAGRTEFKIAADRLRIARSNHYSGKEEVTHA